MTPNQALSRPTYIPVAPAPPVELRPVPAPLAPGSDEHRELLAHVFADTHVRFDAAAVTWPEISAESIANLRALPVWDEALRTENLTARLVQAYASREADPVLRDVIALQGYEEGRHASMIESMARHYELAPIPEPEPLPADLDMAFLRMGHGECMDSFFAFGLFEIAKRSELFPPALVEKFEPLLQEEARHIIFFVNWLAIQRARRGRFARFRFTLKNARAIVQQVWWRIRGLMGMEPDHFTKSHAKLDLDLQPRAFLDLCLVEHERRLAPYDERLLRPTLVPAIVRKVRWLVR